MFMLHLSTVAKTFSFHSYLHVLWIRINTVKQVQNSKYRIQKKAEINKDLEANSTTSIGT